MNMAFEPTLADLGTNLDSFLRAAETFFRNLAEIGWGYMAIALVFALGLQLSRAHAWANALRAAYPGGRVSESRVIASFLVGAGMNGLLPAHGGDALKVVLAKRSVRDSSYPAVVSSFASLSPFDMAAGALVLLYAITQGLLPATPRLPHLPAFDIAFWAGHPGLLVLAVTLLAIGAIVLFAVLARRVEAFWQRLRQGLAIFREPRRYLREVAGWQAVGWVCRFASFWFFLEAFHIGGSFSNVLLVMSVQAISGALPFTPGGAGAQQALLVATLAGPSRASVLAYSVGQQVAVMVWSLAIAVLALVFVFRIYDWRHLLDEGRAARASAGADGG
jgi:uncharacterized membrane protein YbhN (UPF0104 family)